MSYFVQLLKYVSLLSLLLLLSCKNQGLQVEDFDPFSNLKGNENDTLFHLDADLSNAVLNGIEIPTKKQTNNGYFTFQFKVENTSSEIKKYYYKIFYENQNYKFTHLSQLDFYFLEKKLLLLIVLKL